MDKEYRVYSDYWLKVRNTESKNRKPDNFKSPLFLRSYESEISRSKQKNEKWFAIPDVPELEKATRNHKEGLEVNLPEVSRSIALTVDDYREQIGQTCGLTSFRMILGALGKSMPNYEEIMGIPFGQISGSRPADHSRFINSATGFGDIKESRLSIRNFTNKDHEVLRESIFQLLGESNYLYVRVNWQRLHGVRHRNGSSAFDHGIVLHGARETEQTVQGNQVNYLITDPNNSRYHSIWISEDLLFKALLDSVEMYGYRIEKTQLKEKIRKKITGRRPVALVRIPAVA